MRTRVCTVPLAILAVAALLVASPALAQSFQPQTFSSNLFLSDVPAAPALPESTPTPFLTERAPLSTMSFDAADLQARSQLTGGNVRQGFGVFFLIGPMFDQFDVDEIGIDLENQTGLQISLGLGGNFSGVFGVGTELTLLRRKTGLVTDATVNTFQIPLLFYINGGCHRINCLNFHVIFGPAFDFVMSSSGVSIDDIERYQIDMIIGGMVEVSRFMFQVRYVQGFRTISKEFDQFGDIKTKTFVILFGVRLN